MSLERERVALKTEKMVRSKNVVYLEADVGGADWCLENWLHGGGVSSDMVGMLERAVD